MSQEFISPFDTASRLDSEVIANPYPHYRQMRIESPVHWSKERQVWNITRYADVMEALRDRRFSADRMSIYAGRVPDPMKEKMEPIMRIFSNMMLLSDPPSHTRLRSLANKAFTPRVVENMRSHIQAIVDQMLDGVEATGRMDVISDLAYLLPVTVICEMLSVAPEDRDQFKQRSDDLAAFLGNPRTALEHVDVAQRSALEMIDYLRGMIQERRHNPREDLISALVAAEEQGDAFSEEELYSMFVLLQVGGHETTTNLIGNGLLALLQNPEQMHLLGENPSLIAPAVEEFLRYDGPIQMTARIAMEDLEIDGQWVSKGEYIVLYIGAANRDPAQFSDPDRLDIARQENRHLGFGFGPHFCLGAALARLEGQITIGTILRRFPQLCLEPPLSAESRLEDFPWRDNAVFRGLESLAVVFEAAGA